MANKVVELEGIAMWSKVFPHNRDMNEDFHGPEGAYTIDLVLEQDQLDKLSEAGSRLKPKVSEEGITVKFKRKHAHQIEELGGAPKVVDAEGEPWDSSTLIGNGSKVKIVVDVYDTKMGKGTRLRGVQVVDLEEMEDSENYKDNKLPDWLK